MQEWLGANRKCVPSSEEQRTEFFAMLQLEYFHNVHDKSMSIQDLLFINA